MPFLTRRNTFVTKYNVVVYQAVLVLGFVFLLLPMTTSAATYYVDGTVTDTNASSATPDFTTYDPDTFATSTGSASVFASLSDLSAKTFSSGDIVYFRKGQTFRRTSGAFEFEGGVTYGAFGSGSNPQFEGASLITGWTLSSGSVYVASTTLADHAQFMVWEGSTKGNRETSLGSVDAVGDFYLDDAANNLYYISRGGGDPDSYTMRADTNHYPFRIAGNSGRLENLTFAYAGTSLLTNVFNSGTTTGWVIADSRFTNANSSGFEQFGGTESTSLTFYDSEFDNNAKFGALFSHGVVDTLLSGCTFHDNTSHGLFINGVATTTSSNNIIRNATAYNNGQDGINIASDGVDDIIEYSTAYDNGLLVDDRTGIKSFGLRTIIRYNKSYDNNLPYSSGHGFQFDIGAADGEMYGNVAYGNANGGYSITDNGHKLYNNVAYGNLNKQGGAGAIQTFDTGTFTDIDIQNNIFSTNGRASTPGSRYQVYDGNHLDDSSNTLDYNLYYDADSHTYLLRFGSTSYTTLAAFTSATSRETNGIESDPLFADASADDFTLTALSPAIDVGGTTSIVTSTTTDYARNPIYGTPDLGPYEYQPPYTMGTDSMNAAGDIRIYEDGKYRYTAASSSSTAIDFEATPLGGSFYSFAASTTRPAWLDISVDTWQTTGDRTKQWTATSSNATTTIFTVGDLQPGEEYAVLVDGANQETIVADASGRITYTYNGGWSTHTFKILDVNASNGGGGGGRVYNYVCNDPAATNYEELGWNDKARDSLCEYDTESTPTSNGTIADQISMIKSALAAGTMTVTQAFNALQEILKTLLQTSTGTSSSSDDCIFTADLEKGDTDANVLRLQKFLNGHGFTLVAAGPGSPDNETNLFGALTTAAVVRFQNTYAADILTPLGLTAGTGYVGASTRAKINDICNQ